MCVSLASNAAASPPQGLPPPEMLEEHRVDVAILCPASFSQVEDYVEGAVRLMAPRHAILSHWEDFFQSPDRKPAAIRGTDLAEFRKQLKAALPEGAGHTVPEPDRTTVTVQSCSN